MARARSPNREKAFEIYKKNSGSIDLVEIADTLEVSPGTVRGWKNKDGWDAKINGTFQKNTERSKRKKGGQIKNKNAETHGFFSKYLPKDTFNIIQDIQEKNPLDILWENIQIQYAAIIRAQSIMHVDSQEDTTKVLSGETNGDTSCSERYIVQFAWDKQSTFLQAQSRAMSTLQNMIKHYEELIKSDLASEEQKLRIDKLKAEVRNLTTDNKMEETNYTGIPSTMIAPTFSKAIFDIQSKEHLEYVFPGGRGSTKSSFVSLEVIDLIIKNDTMHACILRQVGDTLRTSVYQQVMWAISALGLEDEFHPTVSPLEITRKSTGQKIYFRGADDPNKIKSIKVPFGYIGIAWFEELDQFTGPEAVRKIEQSVIRGGDIAYIFKSFNPPKSANNWANKYIKIPKETRLVVHSTYLDVPSQWLGKPFLDEAEFLKEVNPSAYENEYMGIANGSGGNVFENVTIREVTDSEIATFDRIYNGIDWGWFPDPWAFNRMYYNSAQRKLYIFDEGHENKKSNKDTAKILKEKHNIKPNDKVVCDSSEPKSVEDYRAEGIFARAAIKGPGSVDYSMKWLSSLNEIIIDNVRCPHTATEFLDYEYERDKEGNVISGYPDANNHHIDDIRYALEEVWKRRGQ